MKTSKLKQLHNQIHGRNDVEKDTYYGTDNRQ